MLSNCNLNNNLKKKKKKRLARFMDRNYKSTRRKQR